MATGGNRWQHVATGGNRWQQVATVGNRWQQVATGGNSWQQLATGGNCNFLEEDCVGNLQEDRKLRIHLLKTGVVSRFEL